MLLTLRTGSRAAALLAINLLLLIVWGLAGAGKLESGFPTWFPDMFGKTFLATFPGLKATFWMLTLVEVAAAILAVVALARLEFLETKPPLFLVGSTLLGLFAFVMLLLGRWLTKEYDAGFQMFTYFSGTLIQLHFILAGRWTQPDPTTPAPPRG